MATAQQIMSEPRAGEKSSVVIAGLSLVVVVLIGLLVMVVATKRGDAAKLAVGDTIADAVRALGPPENQCNRTGLHNAGSSEPRFGLQWGVEEVSIVMPGNRRPARTTVWFDGSGRIVQIDNDPR